MTKHARITDADKLAVHQSKRPSAIMDSVRMRWVPGYEGQYAVTDDGRFVSYARGEPRIINGSDNGSGYLKVHLGADVKEYLHRLVLRAFVGRCPDGHICRHLNGDRSDNRLQNLKWGTVQENSLDAERHGTLFVPEARCGELNGNSKLTNEQAAEIRRSYSSGGVTQRELADEYGVDQCTISAVIRGKLHPHSPGPISDVNKAAGESHGKAKLNEKAVRQIRSEAPKCAERKKELAQKHGVSIGTIYDILNRRSWRHV